MPDRTTTPARAGLRRRVAHVPRPVWAVVALFGVLLLAWVQLVPIAQAPDSPGHASLVRRLSTGRGYPDYDGFRPASGTMGAWLAYRPGVETDRWGPWLTPEAAPPRGERPSFDDLGGRTPWAYENQVAQHPPLYYAALAPVARATQAVVGDQPIERGWTIWRLANLALVLPLPLLAWAAARRLGAPPGAALTASVVPLAIPQLLHIGSSINNDNLLNLLGAVLAVGLAGVARGDARPRTAAAVGAVAGLALLTKAHALAFLPWIAIAYAAPLARGRAGDRARHRAGWAGQGRAAAIALGTAAVVGGWWWVRNLVRFGALSPSILDGALQPEPGFDPGLPGYVRSWVPTFTHRFWGSFASYQASLTPVLVVLAAAATVGLAVAAFAPRRRPRGGRDRPARGVRRLPLAALASVVPILGLFVFASGYRYFRETGYEAQMQGRYLFSTVVPLAVVVGVGAHRVLRRRAPLVVLAAAAVLHADGARAVLSDLWAEPDASLARSARALLAWAPVPEPVTVGLAAATLAALALTAVVLGRGGAPGPA